MDLLGQAKNQIILNQTIENLPEERYKSFLALASVQEPEIIDFLVSDDEWEENERKKNEIDFLVSDDEK